MTPPRIPGIDALRGMAALGVAWFHLYTQNGGQALSDAMPRIVNLSAVWGRFGVPLFFAISGFVIAYTLYRSRELRGPASVGRYFMRRSVRLDPAYWVALAVYTVGVPLASGVLNMEVYPPREGDVPEIARNLLYFLPLEEHLYVRVAWTLAIEVQFYLFFAAVVVLINAANERLGISRDGAFTAMFVGLAVFVFAQDMGWVSVSGHGLVHYLNGFLPGIFLALAVLGHPHGWRLFAMAVVLLIAAFLARGDSNVLASIISSVLLVAAIKLPVIARLSALKPIVHLGALSYCIYLFHQLIGGATVGVLKQAWPDAGAYNVAFVIAGILVTVAAAEVVYRAVERPSIAWSKHVALKPAEPTLAAPNPVAASPSSVTS